MKRLLPILIAALLFSGCTNAKIIKKAEPLIRDYATSHYSHPETYHPIKTKVVSNDGENIVVNQTFRFRDSHMELVTISQDFYFSKEMDIVLSSRQVSIE